VLYKGLEAKRNSTSIKELCDRIEGDNVVHEVVLVDQSLSAHAQVESFYIFEGF